MQTCSDWAKEPIKFMQEKGLMTGNDGDFRPKDSLTREEFALVMYRMYNMIMNAKV